MMSVPSGATAARYNELIISLPPDSAFHTMFELCRNAYRPMQSWRIFGVALCVLMGLGLSACSSWITPYRPEVVQGNFVSSEQVQALRMGMPRQAVRDILGTPLVTSLFHSDRWDYAFTIRRLGAEPQQRRLSVFFKADVLDRIEGDPLPTEAEFASKVDTRRPTAKTPAMQATEDALSKFPAKAVPTAPFAAPAIDTRNYPPLESQ
jgi:outer membrane protein assembly factor BamE